jgi:hypothetical protein
MAHSLSFIYITIKGKIGKLKADLWRKLRGKTPITGITGSGSGYAEANPAMVATYHRETSTPAKV